MAAPAMDAAAERFAAQGIGSFFLYTNEAHPGEHYPALTTMADKARHAGALRDVYGLKREIWLDSLDGAAHRHYGSMPNMTWIFNRRGIVYYKAAWTDVDSVTGALEQILAVDELRKERQFRAPFPVQRLDFRPIDREAFRRGLERNGPKAVREFAETFPGLMEE